MWDENNGSLVTIQDYHDFLESRNLFKDYKVSVEQRRNKNNVWWSTPIIIKVVLKDELIHRYLIDKLSDKNVFVNGFLKDFYDEIKWWSPVHSEIIIDVVNKIERNKFNILLE